MVLEMKLPALPAPQTDSVVRVTLTYFNVITSTMDTISCDLVITRAGKLAVEDVRPTHINRTIMPSSKQV